jgi:hypothetical protein
MTSPFPGMDPFIESQRWEGFHARMITALSDLLVPETRPHYACDVEKYVFVISDEDEVRRHLVPDVHVASESPAYGASEAGAVATLAPAILTHVEPLRMEQPFLVLRTTDGRDIVSVIELLSPWIKSKRDGMAEYITKRDEYLHSSASIIEIDLLRGGSRLNCREPLPEGDYYAFISRSGHRPNVEVYWWSLTDRLPTIPVPLLPEDGDVALDLQATFDSVYERAGYDYTLKYDAPLAPPADEAGQQWIDECIKAWRARETA